MKNEREMKEQRKFRFSFFPVGDSQKSKRVFWEVYAWLGVSVKVATFFCHQVGQIWSYRAVMFFSQTLNSIGWHHSSNQRHLLHFSIVLVFIVTKSQIWPKFRPQKIRARGPGFFPRIVLHYIFIFIRYGF